MTSPKCQQEPFNVVARALGCPRESLSIESGMYKDHGWDSFGHVSVIVALEEAYAIRIPNDEILHFTTMRAILDLVARVQETSSRES